MTCQSRHLQRSSIIRCRCRAKALLRHARLALRAMLSPAASVSMGLQEPALSLQHAEPLENSPSKFRSTTSKTSLGCLVISESLQWEIACSCDHGLNYSTSNPSPLCRIPKQERTPSRHVPGDRPADVTLICHCQFMRVIAYCQYSILAQILSSNVCTSKTVNSFSSLQPVIRCFVSQSNSGVTN
jgi:hypothetical protein